MYTLLPFHLLFQDFDEKRQEWRKQKKSVLSAISLMRSRTLRFEDSERRTIALSALDFYTVGSVLCRQKRLHQILLKFCTVHLETQFKYMTSRHLLAKGFPHLRRSIDPSRKRTGILQCTCSQKVLKSRR